MAQNSPTAEQLEYYRKQALDYSSRAIESSPQPLRPTVNNSPTYELFLQEHTGNGKLRVQTVTASGNFPVPNATVETALMLDDERILLYKNTTDQSGIVDAVPLAALPAAYSQTSVTAPASGTEYTVTVYHPAFQRKNDIKVIVFDGVESLLVVEMQPVTSDLQEV